MGFVANWPKTVFLAGNISNTWNWQNKMVEMLGRTDLTVINPRREFFDESNPLLPKQQIAWEFFFLKETAAISFWFDKDTMAPISLYELGFQLGKIVGGNNSKKIFIGVDKEYKRKVDVEEQLRNTKLDININYDIADLAHDIIEWSLSV